MRLYSRGSEPEHGWPAGLPATLSRVVKLRARFDAAQLNPAKSDPLAKHGRIFEPGDHPQDHLGFTRSTFIRRGTRGRGRRWRIWRRFRRCLDPPGCPARAILGGDDQTADGCSTRRIATLILVEQSQKARFEIVESRLADARDYGCEGRAGIAQQLSKVIFRNGREGPEQLGELGFADRGWTGFFYGRARPCPTWLCLTWLCLTLREPESELSALASLGGCHEIIMTLQRG